MTFVALDLEGVLIPEIWPAAADAFGIDELRRTTKDEKNYDKLMSCRIDALKRNNIDFDCFAKEVLAGIKPFDGAVEFMDELRRISTTAIVSDTFFEFFNGGISGTLRDPMVFCHQLLFEHDGGKRFISGYKLRMQDAKRETVRALKQMNYNVFAFGDSYNDIDMIKTADDGVLFRSPDNIKKEFPLLKKAEEYSELLDLIGKFVKEK